MATRHQISLVSLHEFFVFLQRRQTLTELRECGALRLGWAELEYLLLALVRLLNL